MSKVIKLNESDIKRIVKRVLTEEVAKKFESGKYTFIDGNNEIHNWDVKEISNDSPFYITVVDKDLPRYGNRVLDRLELTLNPNGKWVIYPACDICDKDKRFAEKFLKFTNGGLKQDELSSLVDKMGEEDFKSSMRDMDDEGLTDPGEPII